MTIHVITDSTADLSASTCKELEIAVVPAIVRFGNDTFRDGVDMTTDDFYERMVTSPVYPCTSQPSPEDFSITFRKVSAMSQGIVSIHSTSKLSGIYNSALQGKNSISETCPITVLDSSFTSVGLGLVVLAAAKAAKAGAMMNEVIAEARKAISEIKMIGIVDNLEYLIRGGRISRLKGTASKLLGVKPLLIFKEGEIVQSGLVRTFNHGVRKIAEFVENQTRITALAIAHSRIPHRVTELKEQLTHLIILEPILVSELGPALGSHGGPGVLMVAVRTNTP
jgi:DegV family protein with EDD domain